jgi:hypothetical protein
MDTLMPEHAHYCRPRLGHAEPRIEKDWLPRYATDGKTELARVLRLRCLECGSATYDGVQQHDLT